MDNPDNTGARVGVFVILVMVLGIALLATTITAQTPKQPVYLPMVARSVYPGPSQIGISSPGTYLAEKPASVENTDLNMDQLERYQPLRSTGTVRHWL